MGSIAIRSESEVTVLKAEDDRVRDITQKEESALLQACGQSRSRSLVVFVTLAIETGPIFRGRRTGYSQAGQTWHAPVCLHGSVAGT